MYDEGRLDHVQENCCEWSAAISILMPSLVLIESADLDGAHPSSMNFLLFISSENLVSFCKISIYPARRRLLSGAVGVHLMRSELGEGRESGERGKLMEAKRKCNASFLESIACDDSVCFHAEKTSSDIQ
jgi:hypothetical protein